MRILKYLSVLLLTFMIFAGILVPIVPNPQSWLEFPAIPGLGEKTRNIFYHVPVAWVSVLGFLLSLFYGLRYLRKRDIADDFRSASSAGLGSIFCLLAAVTGSMWAKFNWGSFWNWDPRETSIFILLMIYGAYFALRSAINSNEIRARLSAVYVVIAGAVSPFFIFIMPRLIGGLHPGTKGDISGSTPIWQLDMPPNMLVLFCTGLLGFSLLFIWILSIRIRIAKIEYMLSNKY